MTCVYLLRLKTRQKRTNLPNKVFFNLEQSGRLVTGRWRGGSASSHTLSQWQKLSLKKMQMYKNRNGNSKQSSVASVGLHTQTHTYKFTVSLLHTYAHTRSMHTNTHTQTQLIWLCRLRWVQTHVYTLTVTLEKTVRVKIIPVCEKVACCLSVVPAAERQTGRQTVKRQSVCVKAAVRDQSPLIQQWTD